jgi:hypothetical protein
MTDKIIKWKWSDGSLNEKSIRNKDDSLPSNITCNKRELQNEKMNERMLVTTASINPFMANNDYIKDLENQDNFLKPQDSNI